MLRRRKVGWSRNTAGSTPSVGLRRCMTGTGAISRMTYMITNSTFHDQVDQGFFHFYARAGLVLDLLQFRCVIFCFLALLCNYLVNWAHYWKYLSHWKLTIFAIITFPFITSNQVPHHLHTWWSNRTSQRARAWGGQKQLNEEIVRYKLTSKVCVTDVQSFTSCFLYSVETQHTIG